MVSVFSFDNDQKKSPLLVGAVKLSMTLTFKVHKNFAFQFFSGADPPPDRHLLLNKIKSETIQLISPRLHE